MDIKNFIIQYVDEHFSKTSLDVFYKNSDFSQRVASHVIILLLGVRKEEQQPGNGEKENEKEKGKREEGELENIFPGILIFIKYYTKIIVKGLSFAYVSFFFFVVHAAPC